MEQTTLEKFHIINSLSSNFRDEIVKEARVCLPTFSNWKRGKTIPFASQLIIKKKIQEMKSVFEYLCKEEETV